MVRYSAIVVQMLTYVVGRVAGEKAACYNFVWIGKSLSDFVHPVFSRAHASNLPRTIKQLSTTRPVHQVGVISYFSLSEETII